jgi:hypothetical protein
MSNEAHYPRRTFLKGCLASATALAFGGRLLAVNPNERTVKPEANVLDPDKIGKDTNLWVFDFKFKDPRVIKVDVPGRGPKVCWYLWYQVINNSGKPQFFIPDFDWVTLDTKKNFHDQILPKVQDDIIKIEDPNGFLKIKNSVTIAETAIPPSRENADPIAVTGVAIWDDIDPDSNQFSIFIQGLSNGWALTDDPVQVDMATGKPLKTVVRRKTLQLNFKRLGDKYYQKSEEIRFEGPAKWDYRASQMTIPGLPAMPK